MAVNTRKVMVVALPEVLVKHPKADSLSIFNIGGVTLVGRTSDWEGKDRAAYIPPENEIDTDRECFAWMKDPKKPDKRWIKVRPSKLRGVTSYGILVPTTEPIGSDVTELLGVRHYEPEAKGNTRSINASPRLNGLSKYDIEGPKGLVEEFAGVDVRITEKIHGTQGRFCFEDGIQYAGSRNKWTDPEGKERVYWNAFKKYPAIGEFCEANPGFVLYGEIYGSQKHYKYDTLDESNDTKHGRNKFLAFDIMDDQGHFFAPNIFEFNCLSYSIPMVPELAWGKFDLEKVMAYADRQSSLADIGAEGVVIKPIRARMQFKNFDRMIMKIIGPRYKG